ncbi:heavy metal sensor histidine kinase [Pararobbsia silviterrae]|uniref:Sensor protein n=1 Tax=Pararobbsia silviterrae TaxID=1792498 RepID=A0A494XHF6_9BURK|nr:heavy metal sensor histidine kinase [Pararobbsia silviterrae]RKP50187.1 HAMP domain-containing protein [Pararobbsia silviterrae]
MNRSIARRLSLLFAIAALVVFALVGTGLFVVLRVQLDRHLRESLDDRTEIARIIVYHAVTPEKWRIAREKLTDMTPRDGTAYFAVWSDDPNYQFGHPLQGRLVKSWTDGYERIRPDDREFDMLTNTMTLPPYLGRPAVHVQVAAGYLANSHTMRSFGLALAGLSGLGSLLVLLLSRWATRIGLEPLARLTRDASEVRPNNRSQRLDTRSLPFELGDLANSFNGALERLDGAYGRLESFNADVAHELRTPVTILIGQTEVALSRDRSVESLRTTLQSNLEEFERMRAIVNDMLFLARADQGERATGLVDLALEAEVAHTLEFLEIPLEEAGVTAIATGVAHASVNRALFGRALTNLVMNAIQHCGPGAAIHVSLERLGDQILVSVANPGARIDVDVLDHLFDRFYRAEASRSNSRENHGLGLAIVKAIAGMHRGTVFATSINGINTFGFSVAAPDPDPAQLARDARMTVPDEATVRGWNLSNDARAATDPGR